MGRRHGDGQEGLVEAEEMGEKRREGGRQGKFA